MVSYFQFVYEPLRSCLSEIFTSRHAFDAYADVHFDFYVVSLWVNRRSIFSRNFKTVCCGIMDLWDIAHCDRARRIDDLSVGTC